MLAAGVEVDRVHAQGAGGGDVEEGIVAGEDRLFGTGFEGGEGAVEEMGRGFERAGGGGTDDRAEVAEIVVGEEAGEGRRPVGDDPLSKPAICQLVEEIGDAGDGGVGVEVGDEALAEARDVVFTA